MFCCTPTCDDPAGVEDVRFAQPPVAQRHALQPPHCLVQALVSVGEDEVSGVEM